MKRGLALIALALVPVLAACSPGTVGTVDTDAQAKHKVTASTMEDPKLVVGDTATTSEEGNTVTVLSYESPVSVENEEPGSGSSFSAVEVRGCDGPSPGKDLSVVGSNAFALRLSDGTRVQPEAFGEGMGVKEPALRTMDPPPNGCDRGFVTFRVPRDERPELVVFEEQFVLKSAIVWKVPAVR